MDVEAAFIVYAALFKLSMIIAGTVSIYLGYRLFVVPVETVASRHETTGEAALGEYRISFRSSAPGTAFAAFGVGLLIVMLLAAPPELEPRAGGGVALKGNTQPPQNADNISEERLSVGNARLAAYQGNYALAAAKFGDMMADAEGLARRGDGAEATRIVDEALTIFSYALNNKADDVRNSDPMSAHQLIRLGARISPDDPQVLRTLAEISSEVQRER